MSTEIWGVVVFFGPRNDHSLIPLSEGQAIHLSTGALMDAQIVRIDTHGNWSYQNLPSCTMMRHRGADLVEVGDWYAVVRDGVPVLENRVI